MSLFKKSKKSNESDGAPKDLSVAYGIQSKNKKKMSKSGPVEISAKTEPEDSIDLVPTKEELKMLAHRRTKMAEGGWIEGDPSIDDAWTSRESDMISGKPTKHAPEDSWADGEDTSDNASIAENIRKRKKYADGGMVDLDENAKEGENEADELNMDAAGKENYSEQSGLDDLDYDSKSTGDDIESDVHDLVSKIRSKMKSQR